MSDSQYHLHGGFIQFPGGKLTLDADGGAYYDRAFSRWLPVSHEAVSLDGSQYAYLDLKVPGTDARQQLHLVELPSGNEKLYQAAPTGDPAGYVVVSIGPEGIWLSYAGYEGPSGGLFLLDLTTGQMKEVGGQQGIFNPVAGSPGIFWFTDSGPNPQPRGGIGGYLLTRVQRLTVSDGMTNVWFSKDGSDLRVLGIDLTGHPIIADENNVWLGTAQDDTQPIAVPEGFYSAVVADKHGIWLGGDKGIYLYTPNGEVQRISDQVAALAGPCF